MYAESLGLSLRQIKIDFGLVSRQYMGQASKGHPRHMGIGKISSSSPVPSYLGGGLLRKVCSDLSDFCSITLFH